MFVFDTDVLSELLRGRLPAQAQRRFRRVEHVRRFTTAITLGELFYGALRTAAALRWMPLIERLAEEFQCLDFDAGAARAYGELRAQLERAGRPLADPDLRIAAICLAKDFVLVSGNDRHFGRVPGLRYENWLRG